MLHRLLAKPVRLPRMLLGLPGKLMRLHVVALVVRGRCGLMRVRRLLMTFRCC